MEIKSSEKWLSQPFHSALAIGVEWMLARLKARSLGCKEMRGRRKALPLVGMLVLASVLVALHPIPVRAVTTELTMRPSADGSLSEWISHPSGTPNWGCVDEIIQNGDVDYVYVNVSGKADSYGFQSVIQTGSILNLRVSVYARQTLGDERLKHLLVIGGVRYYGLVEYTPGNTTHLLYSNDWSNNPATNSSWIWGDIDLLEAGVESNGVGGWDGEIRVTKLFVEVTVTDLETPKISVTPDTVVGPPPDVDETFSVNITVTNVVDLYAWQVGITFNATVLEALSFVEGPFLTQGGITIMANGTIDNIAGIIHRHSASLTGPVPGASGTGTIAALIFKIRNFGNSDLHLADVMLLDSSLTEIPANMTDGYFEIETPILDVYTQKAGVGSMESGSAFSRGDQVELSARLTYGTLNFSEVNVAFEVKDPNGTTIFFTSAVTNESSLVSVTFRLSIQATIGTYNAYATADIYGYSMIDIVPFEVGWLVYVVSVIPTDLYGNSRTDFMRGETAYFNVTVRNIALEDMETLLTVSVLDELSVPLGVANVKITISSGVSIFIFSVPIPPFAWLGTASINANTFTDWPHLGGVAYAPKNTVTIEIVS